MQAGGYTTADGAKRERESEAGMKKRGGVKDGQAPSFWAAEKNRGKEEAKTNTKWDEGIEETPKQCVMEKE